ncbi:hypothetical protein NPIL_566121 [Nephila pilipes]|uniref:Uncharacterized protein n=1 Tax=Nephila pilipes TaxID=299642 RepID=A0A8X6QZG4_NEPPI|nr:hypothetical protein NPIL_566121 [Nephila pilipes]
MFFVILRLHLYTSCKKYLNRRDLSGIWEGWIIVFWRVNRRRGNKLEYHLDVSRSRSWRASVVSFLLWWSGMSGCYADSSVKHLMRPQKEEVGEF